MLRQSKKGILDSVSADSAWSQAAEAVAITE
jgi:hypothetical protein